jgi:Mitochondria-eating protein
MYNELTHRVSELFKCDCQDVFFDLLSPELNLDGVVFFFANVYTSIFKTIQKHFLPAETAIRQLVKGPLDGPLESVLRKSYQTNWRQIYAECLDRNFSQRVADDLQSTLSI